ncbi:PO113 protein, partial [Chordeiles acutipennis]|nr:PO113 protein [Chordeiles acutipennis]
LEKPLCSATPVGRLSVFTDASKNNHKAAITWLSNAHWDKHTLNGTPEDSLQTLELKAVVWAFTKWSTEPLNVVSDSLYVVGVVARLEQAILKEITNQTLFQLFCQL